MSRSDRRTPTSAPPHSIQRGRARATVSGKRSRSAMLWGVLLVAGGVLTWRAVPHGDTPAPGIWSTKATSASAGQMASGVQELARDEPALLRMEWKEHPEAGQYRILFRVDGEAVAPPLPTLGPVFLYDLDSNVLGLPDRFDWAVAAVLPDGSEVVSPWQAHPAP